MPDITTKVAQRYIKATGKTAKGKWQDLMDLAPDVEEKATTLADGLEALVGTYAFLEALAETAKGVKEDMGLATSCETEEDFRANIKAAKEKLGAIDKLIKDAKVKAKKEDQADEAFKEAIAEVVDNFKATRNEMKDLEAEDE